MSQFKPGMFVLRVLVWFSLITLLLTQGISLSNVTYRNRGFIALAAMQKMPPESRNDVLRWFVLGQDKFPEDNRILYALGLCYKLQGRMAEAHITMKSYVQAVPKDAAGRHILGDIAYDIGDVVAAIESWSGAANVAVFVQKAKEELERGNLDAAQLLLDTASKGDITSYSPAYQLAEGYALLVSELQAFKDITSINLVCDRGSIAFQAAIKAEPTLGFVRINYGALLRKCQRYSEAIAQFQSVDDSMDVSARAWANHEIAQTYRLVHQEEKAVRYFEQAVELAPENSLYRLSLGQAYARMGKIEQARAQFIQIVLDGDMPWKSLAEKELNVLK